MDLTFVAGNNVALLNKLEEFGCDLDSLLYVTKDFFSLCDDIGLTPRQTADVFIRLKNASDAQEGKPLCPDIVIYENNRLNPTRLCAENRATGFSVFFKAVPGQGKVDKKWALYKCEECGNDTIVKRVEVREHFLKKHFS